MVANTISPVKRFGRDDHFKSRGFVTLATGKLNYYKLAWNMLRSYRLHNGNKYPFAILCEEENEYTKKFDRVILLKDCHRDYRDKFRLLTDCPYDENFFIEPDCLIYNDISFFWEIFSNATDFSSFGWNDGKIDTWTLNPQLIKEKLKIDQIPIFLPGYLFIRNGVICKKLYKTILEICDFINSNDALVNDTRLHCGKNLRDDPIFSFAMAATGCSCQVKPRIGKCIYLPGVTKISKISLLERTLNLTYYKDSLDDCSLLHFTSKKTNEGLYKHQTLVLNLMDHHRNMAVFIDTELVRKIFVAIFDIYIKIKRRLIK